MSLKVHPSDWDLHFGPNAPRRRGPIGLLVTVTLGLAFLLVVGVGAGFGTRQYSAHNAAQALTATPLWAQYYAQQTATAVAQAMPTPTRTPQPSRKVESGGNFRSAPRVAPDTVLGQVAAGDVVEVLDSQTVGADTWYRVRLATTTGSVAPRTEGWISGTLLAQP